MSYVLNDSPKHAIPAATRERVWQAVRDLGYTPSPAARALRRGRSDAVLLILPDLPTGPALASFLDMLARELDHHGLSLLTRRERAGQPLSALWRDVVPAAVIPIRPLDEVELQELRAAGVHVPSWVVAAPDDQGSIVAGQVLIGALQVQHLAAAGHRHLGYAAPTDPRVGMIHTLRLDGARVACLELGLDEPVVVETGLDVDSAAAAVRRWRDRDPRVTGICAYNDEHAFAVLAAMRTLGLAAPVDLAVIGVDNVPLAPFASPPLTTIDQKQEMIAAHLARAVVDGLAGKTPPPPPRSELFELVVRESA